MTAPTRPALTQEEWERLAVGHDQDAKRSRHRAEYSAMGTAAAFHTELAKQSESAAYACRTMAALQDAGTVLVVSEAIIDTMRGRDDEDMPTFGEQAEAVLAALRTLTAGGRDAESSRTPAAQEAQTR